MSDKACEASSAVFSRIPSEACCVRLLDATDNCESVVCKSMDLVLYAGHLQQYGERTTALGFSSSRKRRRNSLMVSHPCAEGWQGLLGSDYWVRSSWHPANPFLDQAIGKYRRLFLESLLTQVFPTAS